GPVHPAGGIPNRPALLPDSRGPAGLQGSAWASSLLVPRTRKRRVLARDRIIFSGPIGPADVTVAGPPRCSASTGRARQPRLPPSEVIPPGADADPVCPDRG